MHGESRSPLLIIGREHERLMNSPLVRRTEQRTADSCTKPTDTKPQRPDEVRMQRAVLKGQAHSPLTSHSWALLHLLNRLALRRALGGRSRRIRDLNLDIGWTASGRCEGC